MAIIYSYPFDIDVQDADAWVGTNSSNRKTKQFKASAIADYLNKQGKVSIGGQMNYIFKPSVPNSSGSFTSTGNIKPFDSITSLRVHVNDLGSGNVVDFMTYIVGSQLLIAQQNTPSQFGHYVINSYTATTDPDFYNLALTYIGGNGSLIDGAYYDFVALNIPDGTGSGVDTIKTTDTDFISSTPSIPTAGNVTVTSSLSATGTPDNTTYLRGDNTWASIPPGLAGSGTTNYVAKWSAADTLTDSVIYDNGTNVGIGTTNPGAKLDVNGNVTLNYTGGASASNYISMVGSRASFGYDGSIGSAFMRSSDTSKPLVFGSGTNEFMRIVSSTGNVGIGTTSPLSRLHVSDSSGGVLYLQDSDATSTYNITSLSNNGGNLSFDTRNSSGVYVSTDYQIVKDAGGANHQRWFTSATERMRITSAGNVGIGTSSPAEKLHVFGSGSGPSGRINLQVENTNISSAAAANFKCGTNYASFQYSGSGYAIGELFGIFTSADIPIKFLTNGDTPNGGTQGILFAPGGYLASPTMGVYPSNGGRVGIGTTSPTQKLHVSGSIRIEDIIYDSSNSPGTAGQVLYKPTNDTIGWTNKDSIASIPTSVTATPGGTLSLASNIDFVYFTWSGGSGTFDLNLPIASTHAYKIIRFVCDSTISASDKIHIQGSLGDTVDGGLFYTLNKPYNGVQVWSDGSEWIVIQAKAT